MKDYYISLVEPQFLAVLEAVRRSLDSEPPHSPLRQAYGGLKMYAELQPPDNPVQGTMTRKIEIETTQFDDDPNKQWAFGSDGYVIDAYVEYPSEMDSLADEDLLDLADEPGPVRYVEPPVHPDQLVINN